MNLKVGSGTFSITTYREYGKLNDKNCFLIKLTQFLENPLKAEWNSCYVIGEVSKSEVNELV